MKNRIRRFTRFQFHKGTIKTKDFNKVNRLHPYFNSIKVQLKPIPPAVGAAVVSFQFHKGTIKTFSA